ncbi:MAG TPA: hypothetical protein VGS10_09205 [Terracidiphilus sp.]|nr:hypothetical protein [Terracidiphilus sp.]
MLSPAIALKMVEQIEVGNAGVVRVAVALAERRKSKIEDVTDHAALRLQLDRLASEPEYQEPAQDAENNETENTQSGVLENVHAVAQD